jgi:hypothetical protein
MKTNDIYLCAFPKSGITYLSFLLAAARLHHNRIPMVPTMYNIDYLIIDIHKMANLVPGDTWKDGFGNFFKTHNSHSALPNVVYMLRKPLDTLKSFYHFRRQLGNADTVQQFLAGSEGIGPWIKHVRSWLLDNRLASQSIFVTEYETLVANPAAELEALAAQFGVEYSAETIAFAVKSAGIENMRRLENSFVKRNPVYKQFALNFVRKTSERTVDGFTPDMVDLVETHAAPVYAAVKARIAAE